MPNRTKWWRADTGFKPSGTAEDVVRYEVEELGNEDIGEQARRTGIDLSRFPASQIVWVTKNKSVARHYGEVEEYHIPQNSKIIATDGDGGYLVLKECDESQRKCVPIKNVHVR